MKNFNFLSLWGTSLDNGSRMVRDSFEISPIISRKLFTLLFCLFLGFGQMWADYIELTTTSLSISGSYSSNSTGKDVSGVDIKFTDCISNSGVCMKKSTGCIWNSEAMPYKIDSIVMSSVTYSSSDQSGFYVYGASAEKGTTSKLYDSNGTGKIKIDFTAYSYTYFYIQNKATRTTASTSIKIYYTACTNTVSISAGTPTHATINVGATSLQTCSGTATDRQVKVSVAPASCYAAPVAESVTWTGTAASKTTRKSGPTWNGSTNKYDYVFEFDKDAAGAVQFNISLSTKTTYTVSYNKGTYGTGNNGSGTKTCGEELALPNSAMFTREGYTQKGWSTAQAGNTKAYDLGGSYTANAGTTLYPYWEANDCTITWIVNGDPWTGKGGSTTAKYDGKVANLPTPPNTTDDGCGDKFMGWTSNNIGEAVLDKTDDAETITSLHCFKDVEHSPVIQGTTIFYAVFATYVKKE